MGNRVKMRKIVSVAVVIAVLLTYIQLLPLFEEASAQAARDTIRVVNVIKPPGEVRFASPFKGWDAIARASFTYSVKGSDLDATYKIHYVWRTCGNLYQDIVVKLKITNLLTGDLAVSGEWSVVSGGAVSQLGGGTMRTVHVSLNDEELATFSNAGGSGYIPYTTLPAEDLNTLRFWITGSDGTPPEGSLTAGLDFIVEFIPMPQEPTGILGSHVRFNATLGITKPVVYYTPEAKVEKQYVSSLDVNVTKVITLPDVVELLPADAEQGVSYRLLDAAFYYAPINFFGTPPNAWWERPPVTSTPPRELYGEDNLKWVMVQGAIKVGYNPTPSRIPFPFGNIYKADLVRPVRLSEFNNLSLYISFDPDTSFLSDPPWIVKTATEDVIQYSIYIGGAVGPWIFKKISPYFLSLFYRVVKKGEVASKLPMPMARAVVAELQISTNKPIPVSERMALKAAVETAKAEAEVEAYAKLSKLWVEEVEPNIGKYLTSLSARDELMSKIRQIADEAGRTLKNKIFAAKALFEAKLEEAGIQAVVNIVDPVELTIDLAPITAARVLGLGVGAATTITAGALATALGIISAWNVAAMALSGTQQGDPYGVAYAATVFYVVKDSSGKRHIVYYGQVPDMVWGTWPSEKSFKDIVDMVMNNYRMELGADSVNGKVKTLPTKRDSVLVPVSDLAKSVEDWIDDFVENDVPKNISQILSMPVDSLILESVGVASIYIPYARTNFFDIFFGQATKTLDFSLTERVVRMSLQGVVGELMETTDPAEMVELLGPLEINGHIFENWIVTDREVRLSAGNLMIEGNPLKIEVKMRQQHRWPVYAEAKFRFTHWFVWSLLKGALSLPCPVAVNESKTLGMLFEPFSLVVNYVRGSSPSTPPSKISFTVTGLNVSKIEHMVSAYGSSYFQIQSMLHGVYIAVSGSAFTWMEVGNVTVDGTVWKLWRGVVDVKDFPVLRYIAECGQSISVLPGDVLPEGMRAVGGVVAIDGGYTPTPTKAEFTFYATDSEITAHVEASVGVYYDDPKGGRVWHFVEKVLDTWISSWPDTYGGKLAYRHSVDIQEVTQKAYELSCRLGKPVVIAAMAVIKEASPNTVIIQPDPARHFVYPSPEICQALTYSLTVVVKDALTGQPIQGATVVVENKTLDFGVSAATDTEGKAVFTLSKGGYTVKAMKEGYLPSEPLPVNLLADKTVEILLTPAELKLLTMRVVVYDAESGDRMAGASVTVRNATYSETKATDENGEAVFQLYAGGYDVVAWMEGYRHARKTVSLQENATVYMPLFKLMPNATVTVEVRNVQNSQPIQGATVVFENGTTVYTASTGSDGRATLTVPVGGYTMRVAASGYYPHTQTVYVSGDMEIQVLLAPETVPVEPPIPPGGDSVTPTIVRVVDAVTGERVTGAKVILTRGPYVYESTTNENGEAEFKISNGVYSFRVEHPDYLPTEGSMFMVKGSVYTIQVTPRTSVKSAKLTVYVLDSVTENPIEGAKVTISNASSALVKHTDSHGKAEFVLTAGGYSIRVEKEMYYPYVSEFRFPADRDAEFMVSLDPYPNNTWIPPGSNYTVPAPWGYVWFVASVRFRDGAPFPGASVKIYNVTTNELIGERVSDGEGWARFLLPHGKQYKVNVTASYRGQAFSREYVFTADASYLVMIYLPWYSNYSLPEVGVVDAAFMNRIGLWGKEQVVVFNILSSVEQQVTVAVEAVNYTALLRGVEQVLASKTMTLNLSIGDNRQWTGLKVDGSGWSLVAPRVRILSYQNDTDPLNNERVGTAVLFGPLVDLRVTLYVFIAEYIVPARYPEITKYYTNLKIESGYDMPVLGTASINYSWVSAYTLEKEVRRVSREAQVRAGANWVNETFALPWTNVTVIEAFFTHPYEIVWADNYQVYYLELDEAVKILNVTHPWTVTAGSSFNVTVTVLSNKKMEHPMSTNVEDRVENMFVILPFGVSKWNITAKAPQLPTWSPPQNVKMVVKVGADHYPDDNVYEAYVTVLSQGWATTLILGGLAVAGAVGAYALYRSSKKTAQTLLRSRRRVLRDEEWWRVEDFGDSLLALGEAEEKPGKRRLLRKN